jgi:hypothetical protein
LRPRVETSAPEADNGSNCYWRLSVVPIDASGMLATFLAGTGVPRAEIEDIIRTQYPHADPAAIVSDAVGPGAPQTGR